MAKLRKIILRRFFVPLLSSLVLLVSSIVPLPSSLVYAAVPHLINYQGRLTDSAGTPLNGSYSLTFRIYDSETSGNLLWEETHSGAVIQKGIFSVLLGSVTALNLAFDKQYFLEIKVGSEVMSPRQRITSAGYAIRAETADQAQNANTVGNVGVSTTPAANKILPLDANAKVPLSALGLKVYDSGWFAATTSTAYSKTHSLGTQKLLCILYYASDSSGTGMAQVIQSVRVDSGSAMYSSQIQAITTTTLNVQTGANSVYVALDSNGNAIANYTSGYLRVIALALE